MLQGYLDRVRTVCGRKFLYVLSDRGAALLRGDDTRASRLMETLNGDDWREKLGALDDVPDEEPRSPPRTA